MIYHEAGQFKTSYKQDMAMLPIVQDRWSVVALVTFAVAGLPILLAFGTDAFTSNYLYSAILIPFLILSLASIGLNILVGYCGQISLGTGAFMAIGAYAAYNVAVRLPQVPSILAILCGGIAAAGAGIAFGLPSLRIKGLYLAVTTLAAQFFFDWLFLRVSWFTNGSASGSVTAPAVEILGIKLESGTGKYLFVLAVVVLFSLGLKNLTRGALGRQWMAIRDMDIAAEIIGIRPVYAKLTAFAVSSFTIGVAGALWAFVHLGSWEPLAFSIDRSFNILFMIIVGGLGSILGSFLGTAFIMILPIVLTRVPAALGVPLSTSTISHLEVAVFGILIIFFLIAEPLGLARLWLLAKEKLRIWPFPY
ncbi:branched-chain amino acid ABC transporter permease [Bradyrhizobium sp. AS23.2]|uniref:branched-chain amino acid ABC transporter permease n=1 Tax=Bradyrhizobium sp. AS23.2 TaxID=1680155 RepID=UPI00093D8B4F|nr:branched-chain amino acid ABC transporter permease [Bradyrhizobium sp. AS23.2]OKO83902.1 ABC transporter permease [Bradyrhizobium sp. AS23.2]